MPPSSAANQPVPIGIATRLAPTARKGFLLTVVVGVIGVIVLAVWSIVGLYLWIPLLIRTSIAYSAAVVGSVLSGNSLVHAERALNEAIVLYIKGFTLIIGSLRRILTDAINVPTAATVPVSWKRALIEFVMATLMWALPFVISSQLGYFNPSEQIPKAPEAVEIEIKRGTSIHTFQERR